MIFAPREPAQSDETDALRRVLVEHLAEGVKHEAQRALQGQAQRFHQVAAEFAHLGAVSDELLALALSDVERTPDYFASLTRLGLSDTRPSDSTDAQSLSVIEGRTKNAKSVNGHEE